MEEKHIKFFVSNILGTPYTREWDITRVERLIIRQPDLQIKGVYGVGSFGLVLKVKDVKTRKYLAIKLTSFVPDGVKEFEIQVLFAKYGMSPILHDYQVYSETIGSKNVKWIQAIMDPIQSTIHESVIKFPERANQFSESIECLVKKKYLLGFIHGDMHTNNVVVLNDGKTLGFIDFGLARKQQNPSEQLLDGITLMGSLKNTYSIFEKQKKIPELKSGVPSKYFGVYELVLGIFNFYEKMFSIIIDWSKIQIHPSHAYVYFHSRGIMLHSYIGADKFPQDEKWGLLIAVCKNKEINKVFPDLVPPKIVD